jgi:hypothetical protein
MSTLNPDQWQVLSPYLDRALAMRSVGLVSFTNLCQNGQFKSG